MMGSRLWLESEPGKGSQFHFVARFELHRAASDAIVPSFEIRALRTLVVDDNVTNRRILTEIIESLQMKVASAESAHTALEMLHRAATSGQPFHLVVTDALMPEVDGFTLAERIADTYKSAGPRVILLTSAGAPALRGRRTKLFAATLAKPVKQSDLLDAIVTVFATPARRARTKDAPVSTRGSVAALRVLVAEDNPTNQKLVCALLEQKGHQITVVNNGRLAVERAAQGPFDLILMDVQMPEVSGLEATALIRAQEKDTGLHVPIVALTARAMAGDREQCFAAGMDGYVSKPVRADELFSTIDALTRGAQKDVVSGFPGPTLVEGSRTGTSIDLKALLAGFAGSGDLVKEVIDVFLTDAPVMLERLKNAARAGDVTELGAAAHAIKGSAGLFSQGDAYEKARALEQRARGGDGSDAHRAADEIEASVSQLMNELRSLHATL